MPGVPARRGPHGPGDARGRRRRGHPAHPGSLPARAGDRAHQLQGRGAGAGRAQGGRHQLPAQERLGGRSWPTPSAPRTPAARPWLRRRPRCSSRRPRTRPSADQGLTDRELEILQLMVDGLSNPDIAKKLFVSRSTVKFHVSNILMKLGASSRTEAVSMAIHGSWSNEAAGSPSRGPWLAGGVRVVGVPRLCSSRRLSRCPAAAGRRPRRRSRCSSTGTTKRSSSATTWPRPRASTTTKGLDVTILEGGPGTSGPRPGHERRGHLRHHLVRRAARHGRRQEARGGRHGGVPDTSAGDLLAGRLQHPRARRPGRQEGGGHHRLLEDSATSDAHRRRASIRPASPK